MNVGYLCLEIQQQVNVYCFVLMVISHKIKQQPAGQHVRLEHMQIQQLIGVLQIVQKVMTSTSLQIGHA